MVVDGFLDLSLKAKATKMKTNNWDFFKKKKKQTSNCKGNHQQNEKTTY